MKSNGVLFKLSRVKKNLLELIAQNTGLSKVTIWRRINSVREELGFMYSRRISAYIYAIDQGIDVSSYVDDDDKELVKEALNSRTRIVKIDRKQQRGVRRPRLIKFSDAFEFECPNLPSNVVNDAKRMYDAYPYFYLFENSVRYFIINTLTKHGSNWWNIKVSRGVRTKAERRIKKEDNNKWHGKRGKHPIFYVDISDLRSIILTNYNDFKDKLDSVEWLTQRINEIELSRNTIAHNNALDEADLERVKIYFKDWIKVIS